MPKIIRLFNRLLILVIGFSSFIHLHAQDEDLDGLGRGNAKWKEQIAINIFYPDVVTEIITLDGRVYRGTIEGFPSADNDSTYFLKKRNGDYELIQNNDIKEYAWVQPDKREFKHTLDAGFNMLFSTPNNAGISPGLTFSIGYEVVPNYILHLDINGANFRNFNLDELSNKSDVFSMEVLIGYRFNRTKKHIQTLSIGGGLIENLDNRGINLGVVSALFDYEFPLKDKSGVSLFTRFQFYGTNAEMSHLLLGCKIRFYRSTFL